MTENIQKHLSKMADAAQASAGMPDLDGDNFNGALYLPENLASYLDYLISDVKTMPALSFEHPSLNKNLSMRIEYRRAYKMQRHFYHHIGSNRAALERIARNKVPYNLNLLGRMIRFLGKALPALRW